MSLSLFCRRAVQRTHPPAPVGRSASGGAGASAAACANLLHSEVHRRQFSGSSAALAGHNRWSQIKRDKGVNDLKRARVFAKLGRELTNVARQGGTDERSNERLSLVVLKAKAANMPRDRVEAAIARAAGRDGQVAMETVVYEATGPAGVALLIEAMTDNRKRTAPLVRHALSKHGANQAVVGHLFVQKGELTMPTRGFTANELIELAAAAGAEDISFSDEAAGGDSGSGEAQMVCAVPQFSAMRTAVVAALAARGSGLSGGGLTRMPAGSLTVLDEEQWASLETLVDTLEDIEDVSEVFHTGTPEEAEQGDDE